MLGPIESWCASWAADRGRSACPSLVDFLTDVGWIAGDDLAYYVVRCGLDPQFDVVGYPLSIDTGMLSYWYFDPSGAMVAHLQYPCRSCWLEGSRCCGDGAAEGGEWFGAPVAEDCFQEITHEYSRSEFPGYVPPPFHLPWFDTGVTSESGCGGCDSALGSSAGLAGVLVAAAAAARRRARRGARA